MVCGVGSFCTLLVLDVEITFTVPKFKPQHTPHPQIPTVLSYKMSPLTEISQFSCAFFFFHVAMNGFVLQRSLNSVRFPTYGQF